MKAYELKPEYKEYVAGKTTVSGTFRVRGEPEHEHVFDKHGKCSCGKVLPDIRPYPCI